MPNYRFKDGYTCTASSPEEAKKMHKVYAEHNIYEEAQENVLNSFWKVEEGINEVFDVVDKSIRALDVVNKDSFSKEVVKEYIGQVQKCLEENNVSDNMSKLDAHIHTLTSKAVNMKDWAKLCLSLLPDDISVKEADEAKESLEALCH